MASSRKSLELFASLGALTGMLGSSLVLTPHAIADSVNTPALQQSGSNEGGEGGEGEAKSNATQPDASNKANDFEGGEGGERGALKDHPFYVKIKNETELEATKYEENLTEVRLGYEAMLGRKTYFHIEAGPGYATNADGDSGAITSTEAKLVQYVGRKLDAEVKYVGQYGHASQLFNSEVEVELKYRF